MKKFVSLVLSMVFMSYLLVPVFSSNANKVTMFYADDIYRKGIVNENNFEIVENSVIDSASYFQYGFNVGGYVYSAYSTLSTIEKVLYDSFVSNLKNGVLSVQIDYSPAMSSDTFSSIRWQHLLEAICLDHPEFFYITALGRAWATYSDGSVAYIILTAVSKSYYDSDVIIYSETEIPECEENLNNKIKSIDVDLSNRYNFVVSLHNYLCNNIVYINNELRCHDVYGALVEGEAVCQGYAESFKLVCDYYKIPAVCLTGTGVTSNGSGPHMWNAVQMDDGLWYLLDITWDDQGSRVLTDFLLIGLNTVDTHFGGKGFSVSHVSDGLPYLPTLPYADGKYTQTNHNTAFKATYNSDSKDEERILVRSFFDANQSCVYYNGIYVETTNVTNSKFTVPGKDNSTDEEWTLVLLGDCNGDGFLTISDYSDAVNIVLSDKGVSTAFDLACDVDYDGSLDVIDLSILQLSVNGLNNEFVIEK